MKSSCLLNRAACCLKTGEYEGVIRDCSQVIEDDFNNVKALFRRGQAHAALKVRVAAVARMFSNINQLRL